jgi:mono/diheme cytochrome c family protein
MQLQHLPIALHCVLVVALRSSVLCALVLLGGRSLYAQTPAPSTPAPSPPVEDALQGLFALDPVAHGAWLYHEFCYRCHGDYGEARQGAENDLARVLDLMINGTVDMAAMSVEAGGTLTRGEIDAIAAYIARWEEMDAPPPLPLAMDEAIAARYPERTGQGSMTTDLAGDLERGAALFAQHCVVCHGATGEGGIGATLDKEWAVDWPDRTVRRTIAHGVPRSAMIAWSQARGGPLREQEIADLTLYVLSLSPQAEIPGFLPAAATPAVTTNQDAVPTATPAAIVAATVVPEEPVRQEGPTAAAETVELPTAAAPAPPTRSLTLILGLGAAVLAMVTFMAYAAWRQR